MLTKQVQISKKKTPKRIYILTKKYIPLEKIHTSIQIQLKTKEERWTGVENFINSSSSAYTQADFFQKRLWGKKV